MSIKFFSALTTCSLAFILCCHKDASNLFYVHQSPSIQVGTIDSCINASRRIDSADVDLNSNNSNDLRIYSIEECVMDTNEGKIISDYSLGLAAISNSVSICPGTLLGGVTGHWNLLKIGDTIGVIKKNILSWMPSLFVCETIDHDTLTRYYMNSGYGEFYIGLMFSSTEGDRFGWAKFGFNAYRLTLIEYAYSTDYNNNIIVGQED